MCGACRDPNGDVECSRVLRGVRERFREHGVRGLQNRSRDGVRVALQQIGRGA